MHRIALLRRWPGLIVAAVAIVAAFAGMAVASIPDGSGAIHGCYQKNDGTLRVIDTSSGASCRNSEVPLSWSQTGPKGDQGPPGPSDAYTANSLAFASLAPGSDATVLSKTVPAGNYVINGQVQLDNFASSVIAVDCDLQGPSGEFPNTQAGITLGATNTGGSSASVPVQATVNLPSGGTVSLDCQPLEGNSGDVVAFETQLNLTAVGAIH